MTTASHFTRPTPRLAAAVACCLLLSLFLNHTAAVTAQTTCTAGNTPGTSVRGRLDAWPQNALV